MLSLALTAVLATWTCDQEDARIRAHLEDAYSQLTHAVPEGLTSSQQQERARALERLRAYIATGRFPRNHSERAATPVFVDEADTHCAMGQLLSELGADDVVQRVRSARNLATVPSLADEPGLESWLTKYGMTPEEAALVQPTYFYCQPIIPCGPSDNVYDAVLTRNANDAGLFWDQTISKVLQGRYYCAGEPGRTYVENYELVWPSSTVLGWPQNVADDGLGWVSWVDANCAERPHLQESDRLIQDYRTCVRTLAQRDLRWLAIECYNTGWFPERTLRCNPDGRFRAGLLPPRGTMLQALMTWLPRAGLDLADAGVDPVLYEALEERMWELSDDGGMALDAGVLPVRQWDGGTIPLDQACIARRDAGSIDGPPDAGRDAGTDAGLDAGADAGLDAGAEVATDAGDDAGVVDAGRAPASDAGMGEEPPMPVGFGCSSLETLASVLVLLGLIRRRRR